MTPTTLDLQELLQENNQLKVQNQELKVVIEDLNALVESLQVVIRQQQHQMDQMLKRLYGRSSEKLDPNQLLMQGLILEADQNTLPKAEDALIVVKETKIAAHTRRHHGRQRLPEHLARVTHTLDINEQDKTCNCGKCLVHIGDDVTERLDYQPSSLFVNSYVRPKYACGDSTCDYREV